MSDIAFVTWLNVSVFILFGIVFIILLIRVKNGQRKQENERTRMEHRQNNNDDT